MHRELLIGLAAWLVVGCGGDVVGSVGEKGRVRYSLWFDFEVDPLELTDVAVVTGHPQTFLAGFTEAGETRARDRDRFTHRLVPENGVSLFDVEEREGDLPPFTATVDIGGAWTIETIRNGTEVFDRLAVDWAEPDAIEVITYVREPLSREFFRDDGTPAQATQGGEITFLTIPNRGGGRLVGRYDLPWSSSDDTLAVPDVDLAGVYEDGGVYVEPGTPSFVLAGAGEVTITFEDEPNLLTTTRAFEVAPRE